jgi:hypothetical protein
MVVHRDRTALPDQAAKLLSCDHDRQRTGSAHFPTSRFLANFWIADDSGPGHYLVGTFTFTALIVAFPLYLDNH